MSTLVSIIMPTRNSFDSLFRALNSIKNTAEDFGNVEIMLRLDDDDHERIDLIPELKRVFHVKPIIGTRGVGYQDMKHFVDDLTAVATGSWAWLFDDDAWVEGKTWQSQLANIPCDPEKGPAVNTQFYKLGFSLYENGPKGEMCGIIIPLAVAKTVHSTTVDVAWFNTAKQKGWAFRKLKGVTYFHDGRAR
jgi:Glycosyl transferase family 2